MGKGEIARYEQFLLLPPCFQTTVVQTRENQGLFGKRLRRPVVAATNSKGSNSNNNKQSKNSYSSSSSSVGGGCGSNSRNRGYFFFFGERSKFISSSGHHR